MSYKIDKLVPVIERGVPPPKPRRQNMSYPFSEMLVGDSFFVASTDGETGSQTASRVANAARHHARSRDGVDFVVRGVEGGARCWRIK